ncbi:hypothetical protein ORV05_32745 [Amycolatopsis cynarae]|uniref:Uncharacterized protein n=1 Tax=Amycolatopsis cynarae TaxID=2995223 RepID=A0ABY7B1M4_9PSEU|nr:hypothetical protein [Amycolatopsis sp. HUAS 11-8]WAL65598.1 hypothetical protein ORV05_32745 [Amycolatopsis sp. HUAS 11-8]
MTRFLITDDPSPAARPAKNLTAGPGLPNQTAEDSKGRNPMVDAPRKVVLSEQMRKCLRDPGARYPVAYGFLLDAMDSVLAGTSDLDRLRAVSESLEAELRGEAR